MQPVQKFKLFYSEQEHQLLKTLALQQGFPNYKEWLEEQLRLFTGAIDPEENQTPGLSNNVIKPLLYTLPSELSPFYNLLTVRHANHMGPLIKRFVTDPHIISHYHRNGF